MVEAIEELRTEFASDIFRYVKVLENREIEVVEQRIALFIDSEQVPQDSLKIGDGMESPGGPYVLDWSPELAVGLHQATFQFVTDSGKILEYSWEILVYW